MDVFEIVNRCLATVMEESGSEDICISEDSLIIEDLDMSSLEILEAISMIEDELGVVIKEKELDTVSTVGDLAKLAASKLA